MKLKPKSTTKNPKALVYKRFLEIDTSFNKNAVYVTTDDKYWLFNQENLTFVETSENENAISVSSGTILKYSNSYFYYKNMWVKTQENAIPEKKSSRFMGVQMPDNIATGIVSSFRTLGSFKLIFYYNDNRFPTLPITGYILQNKKKYYFSGTAEKGKELVLEPSSQEDTTQLGRWVEIFTTEVSAAYPSLGFDLTVFETPNELLSAKFDNIGKYQTNKYYYYASFDFMIKGSIEGTTAQYIKGNIIPLTALNIKHFDDNINLSPDDLVVIENRLYSVENPETVLKQQPKPFKIYFATLNNIL